MEINVRELRARRADMVGEAEALVKAAELEDRNLTDEEQAQFDGKMAEADALEARAKRQEKLGGIAEMTRTRQAPTELRIQRGDSEARALGHFIRTGDMGGVSQEMRDGSGVTLPMPTYAEMRAVVDSTMNVTTAADGKNAVPIPLANSIAMKMNESWLTPRLGLQQIPGRGTTVNHAYDNADPVAFTATSEQADDLSTNDFTRDAMVLGQKAFTLVKYTKKLNLTEELLDDEDVNLMSAIADWIGRAMAVTHNTLLLTEVAANGTAFKTFASATVIAAGEPEGIVYNDTLGYYLDDGSSAAWVGRPSTFGEVASITGNARMYAETPGGSFNRDILGYPFLYSSAAGLTAASAKSLYFGDWFRVGFRLGQDIKLITDPYSQDGVVVLKYSFRTVYGVLQAGGIGYGVHPSA